RSVMFARLVIAAFMIVSKNPRMPYTINGTIAYCAQVLIQPVNRLEVNPNSAIEMKNGAMPKSTNSATLPISTSVMPTLTKTTASRISTSPRIARPTTENPEPEDATTFAAASALARSVESDELTLASAVCQRRRVIAAVGRRESAAGMQAKRPPISGAFLLVAVFSRRRGLVVAGPRRQARPLPGVTGACFERADNCPHSSQGYERDA